MPTIPVDQYGGHYLIVHHFILFTKFFSTAQIVANRRAPDTSWLLGVDFASPVPTPEPSLAFVGPARIVRVERVGD